VPVAVPAVCVGHIICQICKNSLILLLLKKWEKKLKKKKIYLKNVSSAEKKNECEHTECLFISTWLAFTVLNVNSTETCLVRLLFVAA
jgi:hypothetical protein